MLIIFGWKRKHNFSKTFFFSFKLFITTEFTEYEDQFKGSQD